MGTGPPFDEEVEREAARILRQLSDYTSTVVRQEIDSAPREHAQTPSEQRDPRRTAGGLLGLLGLATFVAAGVILLANVMGAGLAAIAIGSVLLALALVLILGAARQTAQAGSPDSGPQV